MSVDLKYYSDDSRHLICVPYTRENLMVMMKDLNINPCWLHRSTFLHVDIPKRRIAEIQARTTVISGRELVTMIKEQGLIPERRRRRKS